MGAKFDALIASQFSEKRYLLVIQPYDVAGATVRSLYFSSHGFNTSPTDSPANTHFSPRLNQAYQFTRQLFSKGNLTGRTVPGYGKITLNNSDGKLDYLANYALGGRSVTLLMGGPGFAYSDYVAIFTGTAQGWSWDDGELGIELRSLEYLFDLEIQTNLFAGTGNAEGTADMKGRRKPICYGVVRRVEPIYCGPSAGSGKPVFVVNDGPITGILNVYDRGAPLTYAASPAGGQYNTNISNGTIGLGGTPVGPVSVDVLGTVLTTIPASGSNTIASSGTLTFNVPQGQPLTAGMWVRIAASEGNYMDGTINSYGFGTTLSFNPVSSQGSGTFTSWSMRPWGDLQMIQRAIATRMGFTSFAAPTPPMLQLSMGSYQMHCGYWLPEGGKAIDLLDSIADGTGTFWGFTRSGQFQVGQIGVQIPGSPTPTPVAYYNPNSIIQGKFSREPIADPSYSISIRYQRTWSPLGVQDLASSVTNVTPFTEQWRQVNLTNTTLQAAYPLSPPLVIESLFDYNDGAGLGATQEANRQKQLFGVRRDYFKAGIKAPLMAVDLAQLVQFTYPRYGLSSGKNFYVVDIDETADGNKFEFELGIFG